MQMVVETLRKKGNIYKKIKEVPIKELGMRNKIKLYKATDIKGYFWSIFVVSQKSKLLMKDVSKFEEIHAKFSAYCEHNFKYKIILLDAPICSKAKLGLKTNGWKIANDIM